MNRFDNLRPRGRFNNMKQFLLLVDAFGDIIDLLMSRDLSTTI